MKKNINRTSSQLFLVIMNHVYTLNDANRALELIRRAYETYYFSKDKPLTFQSYINSYIQSHNLSETEKKLLKNLPQLKLHSLVTSPYSILEEVENTIHSCPILTLYIPEELENRDIQKIGIWARKNIHENVLISFIIDPAYIGGCGISWKGILKDYGFSQWYTTQRKLVKQYLQ